MGKWAEAEATASAGQGTNQTSHNVSFTTQYMDHKLVSDASIAGEFVAYT